MEEEDNDLSSLPDTRVFVTGLPPNFTSADLGKHFAGRYQITDAQVIPGRRIGFVGFRNYTLAKNAIKYFDKTYIRMSKIGVAFAKPIDLERPAEGGQARPASAKRAREVDTNKTSGNQQFQQYVPITKAGDNLKRKRDQGESVPQSTGEVEKAVPAKESTKANGKEPIVKLSKEERKEKKKKAKKIAETQQAAELELAESETKKKSKKKHKDDASSDQKTKGGSHASQDAFEDTAADVDQPNARPSDDDWLRAKTSRVLDLVKDGEHLSMDTPDRTIDIVQADIEQSSDEDDSASDENETAPDVSVQQSQFPSTRRLFVRNLPFSTEEPHLWKLFSDPFPGKVKEVHVVKDHRTNQSKGFAYISFSDAKAAQQAATQFDGKTVQGRILHVLPATEKALSKLDDYELSKLPLKKQNQIKRKAEAGSSTVNWNSLYMNSDAVISSIADRLGVAKHQVLDPTSSDAAVKQAQAETHVIQETKDYFSRSGVDFDSFQSRPRGGRALLVKNLAFGTSVDDLKALFNVCGEVTKVLLPPSGVLGIVEFAEVDQAQRAIKQLAYRNLKGAVLYLEKAPQDIFHNTGANVLNGQDVSGEGPKEVVDDIQDAPTASYTLFVRNLNFATTSAKLADTFSPLEGFLSAKVKTRTDSKRPGEILSMGYGFVEFQTKQQAQVALKAINGYRLDGHELLVKFSQQTTDAGEERRREEDAKKNTAKRTKIIIKNLPFEASKKDIQSLFGAYGKLRSVRVPKKFDRTTRGFAFAEFVTAREAENAMDALKNTHLLGRRLVLDFATADVTDPEEEIRAMEKKISQQAEKVELQKLAGSGRKKFFVGGARDETDE